MAPTHVKILEVFPAMNGVLGSICKCVLARPISLSHRMHRMGEGIHWRGAEFVGLMLRHVRRSDSPQLAPASE